MKHFNRALAVALLGLLLPTAALAAPSSAKMQHVALHVPMKYSHNMHFQHVTASATLRYAKMDIYINVTTDNLPAPSTLHKKFYVVWATDGAKKQALGALNIHGNMAGLKASTMWHKVQDIVVTAENTTLPARPAGPAVLSGMVG